MAATPRALISLANHRALPARRLEGLAVVDFDARTATRVASSHPSVRVHHGAVGMARLADGYVILLQAVPTQAVVLNADFAVVDVMELPSIVDPHCILVLDGVWLAQSTGSDSIVAIDPGTGRTSVVWRAPTGGSDVVHVNSMFSLAGELCISAMCRSDGALADSTDGIVLNLHSGETLMRGIFHPHSARGLDGQVVLCESSRRRVISSSGSILDVPLGYVRGLDITDRHVLVGTSRTRQPPVERCTVQLYERTGAGIGAAQRVSIVDVGELSSEIFDILAVE
jgi:hypothetical protein